MSAPPWTIKDRTLWKRLVHIYEPDDLTAMIDKWFESSVEPHNFVKFYIKSPDLKPKDYEW